MVYFLALAAVWQDVVAWAAVVASALYLLLRRRGLDARRRATRLPGLQGVCRGRGTKTHTGPTRRSAWVAPIARPSLNLKNSVNHY